MNNPTSIFAIDPGPEFSAFVEYKRGLLLGHAKVPNADLLEILRSDHWGGSRQLAIEMIASYGMPVGREVFETCVFIGRCAEAWNHQDVDPIRVTRHEIKMHLCHSARANDAAIRQALIDRFGPGKDRAIGKKASPGPLYGLAGDEWAALALAVTVADRMEAAMGIRQEATV